MKVGMYYNNNDVRVEEMPIPEISDDEILVKTIASGICGSDVMEWYRIKKAPIVLGHEIAGIIDKAGKNVKNFKVGDRVFVSHHVPCLKCYYCENGHETACETLHKTNFFPGGYSEYIRIPKINIELGTFKLPDNMSFDEGTFIEPLACIIRGQRVADLNKDDALLVIGSGISGLMHIALAKSKGVKKIIATDINDFRLNSAKKFGADLVLNATDNLDEKIREFNDGRLPDLVIVCTGSLIAAKQALKLVDKGSRILFFAVPKPDEKLEVPINDFWRNEVKVMTSYGAAPRDLKEAIELISEKKLDLNDMITHKLKFEDIGKGFKLVAEAKDSIKVIVEMDE
ncbi:alcohol dehydrogenase [archaeon]|jgi:L-iditol 2-dehydrogenase|nr:alcohol dehydrogenase [archaeon]MDP6547588.1 zinc-dependent dehydrogenase [Candidatus Woesearchaeota archaeon]|tara:strand:+ start:39976 stop:41001 length:1026 start_codon:yes stop_codon:yes gene_type:complete